MKRATVTISDDLASALDRFVQAQDAAPPFTAIVQAALHEYLRERGYLDKPTALHIRPAARGSGGSDASEAHDRYLSRR